VTCPVCDSPESTVISGSWDDRKIARCDECGTLYDHLYVDGAVDATSETVNCPGCGSPNDGDRETCSHCGATLS
jgi:translation initiation factor 2 beta subunit (eIF-2beta)/eIF-5